jgi:ElaB/YqjD/DUF883 family membrane-anchored ribosome-binding protein
MRTISENIAHRTTSIQRLNDKRNKMVRGDDKMRQKSKQVTKFGNVVIIENQWKSEATKLEAAKVEVLL